jgi:hypothetical protein
MKYLIAIVDGVQMTNPAKAESRQAARLNAIGGHRTPIVHGIIRIKLHTDRIIRRGTPALRNREDIMMAINFNFPINVSSSI